MAPSMDMRAVTAILILDSSDGARIFAKYYTSPHHAPIATVTGAQSSAFSDNPYPDVKSQLAFEKELLAKTSKQNGDVILLDNRLVLYKMEGDVGLYVVGPPDENEVLLYNTCLALRDGLFLLFKANVDKRTIIENYDLVTLAIDEIVDSGIILEMDPTIVVQRVSKALTQDTVNLSRIDPFSEQGINNLAQLGKSKFGEWLRQGL